MNYVYKAIRNETKRAYSVVSEIIKAHAYSSMSRKRRAKFLVMAFLLSFSGNAYADLTREQEEVFDAVMNAWAEGHGMHYFSVVKDPRKNDGHGHTIADGNADNKGATGYGSIAIGQNAATTTNFGMAIGYEAATEGQYALAVGTGAKAKTNFSTAIGKGANGAGKISLAVGYLSQALGKQATVFGGWAQVKNNAMNGLAIGTAAYVGDLKTDSPEPDIGVDRYKYRQVNDDEKPDPGNEHNNSIAIGAFANSFGYQSLSLGPGATTYDFDSMALGAAARAQGNFAIALGKMSIAEGRNTMALGHLSQACGEGSVSLGAYSLVDDGMVNSLALGSRSVVEAENSVALGADARVETLKAIDGNAYLTGNKDYFTAANGVVSVGHGAYTENDGNVEKTVPASYRRIINVAGGQADHDVVNVAQLKALETKLTQKGVKYFSVNSDTYKKAQPAGTADNSGNDGVMEKVLWRLVCMH